MVQQGHQQHGALNYPWWMGSLSVLLLEQVAWLLDGVGPFLATVVAALQVFGAPQVDPGFTALGPALNGPGPGVPLDMAAEVHPLFPHGHLCWLLGLALDILLLVLLLGGCSAILQALVPHGLLPAAGSRLGDSKL